MTNSKNTKRALLASVLSLAVCCAMLLGTTFAWFTDTVTSGNNIIKSGNLDISASYQNVDMQAGTVTYTVPGFDRVENGKIKFSAEKIDINKDNAIISEDLWEPGAVGAKLITVKNDGTLAAKIKLSFAVEDGGLQNALWFDFVQVEGGDVTGSFTEREMSTLDAFAGALELPLMSKEEISFILLYGMKEEAGNEYMDKSFSADVAILATQYTKESDSFDDQYDKDAAFADVIVKNETELKEAITNAEDGDVIAVAGNMELTETLNINKDITIDGMGTGVISKQPVYVGENNTVTIRNMTFTAPTNQNNNASSLYAQSFKGKLVLENVEFVDFQWEGVQITPVAGAEIVVNNCYFSNSKTMEESDIETKRYFHVEVTDTNTDINDIKVTLTNNTFNNVVQSAKGGNGYFSDSAVTICGVPKANLTCEGNVFTGNVAENALTDYNIIWIQNGRLTTIQSLLFDGFEIRK